jgi:hypothetical protein
MAVLHNEKPRLMWGPRKPGFKAPQWIPGKNRLDPKYWDVIKNHKTITTWLELGFIRVELDEELPDQTPPTPEQLAEFTPRELKAALKDPDVPITWHTALERELASRKEPEPLRMDPPKPEPPPERASLTGITVEDARPLIAAETDADKLVEWADTDGRVTIRKLVDERLAELESGE